MRSRINAAHLIEASEPAARVESARVDCGGMFGKHAGVHAADFNFGTKAGGTSRRGCWCNQARQQGQLT